MVQGRRPAGVCGACLLLAARMNNFRRSVEEIVQVVKIADTTLKKRLDEFRKTPSGKLTLADFRRVWLEEEQDPPAFTKGNEKEEREKKSPGKKRKRERDKEVEEDDDETQDVETEMEESIKQASKDFDPLLFGAGMGAGQGLPLFLPDVVLDEATNIDPALREKPPPSPLEKVVDEAVTEEVSSVLQTDRGLQVSQALNEAEDRRNAAIVPDEFADLDDEELDQFILTEEEVKIKERVWVEMNKDYLEAIAGGLEYQFEGIRGDLTNLPRTLAKAEMVENSEGKETKSRKVRSSGHSIHVKNNPRSSFENSHSAVKLPQSLATRQLPTGPPPQSLYGTCSRKTPDTARKLTMQFSISSSNLGKVPLPTAKEGKRRKGRRRSRCIVLMRRIMERARRWSRKVGSIRRLCGVTPTMRRKRRISRMTTGVGKICSNKKCNSYIRQPCCTR